MLIKSPGLPVEQKLIKKSQLELYGEIISLITEMLHPDSDQGAEVGNGTYFVKLKLVKPIDTSFPS